MSFQRVHQSKSQSPQASSSTSQFAPRPFPIQEPQRPPTQEDIENEAFQQNKFEAFGLQLKEKHGNTTPVEQERLGLLQAKMDNFWAQRMERAKAQPNLLEILIRNSQATQTTESQAPVHSNAIRAKGETTGDRPNASVEQCPNKTGMPDALKAGLENLSGYSLNHVRVHYNSPKPARLHALAYTQGTEIHVASGQEEHLPHEAWHVVQQAWGKVQPTMKMKNGTLINDDQKLEHEANVMGAKALESAMQLRGLQEEELPNETAATPIPSESIQTTRNVQVVQRSVTINGKPLKKAENLPKFETLPLVQQQGLNRLVVDEGDLHEFTDVPELLNFLRGHALVGDTQTVRAQVLDWLRQLQPDATVADLLTDTHNSRKVWEKYQETYPKAHEIMLRSILGGHEVHRTGYSYSTISNRRIVTDPEAAKRGYEAFNAAYTEAAQDELIKQYNLTPMEVKAVKAYTSPNKNKNSSEYYMGGDRSKSDWSPFLNGWKALESAMGKIPSLGNLGVEITTYRVPRARTDDRPTDELGIYSQMRPGTNIMHGYEKMIGGQHHYTSTALTYSVHYADAERAGVVTITGRSGRYINPFGVMTGAVDGGEILYPPHVHTVYEGANPTGVETKKGTRPVYHLREVHRPQTGEDIVEDNAFKQVHHPRSGLQASHHQILSTLSNIPDELVSLLHQARERSGVRDDVMYLSTVDLLKLTDTFRMKVISRLEATDNNKVHKSRKQLEEQDDILYMPLDRLIWLYCKVFDIWAV